MTRNKANTYSVRFDLFQEPSRLVRPLPRDLEALLSVYERCELPRDRAEVARALTATGARDARVRALLVRLLDTDPAMAAELLTARGDPAALPALSRRLDSLFADPIGDCPVCDAEHLAGVADAIVALGGWLTPLQRYKLQAARDRGTGTYSSARPAPSSLRAGRNQPCPCGSGKKYKKCCLAADQGAGKAH